jgi:phenylacetate-coenzyme A ligase PaaK-like adenylate-forming protein
MSENILSLLRDVRRVRKQGLDAIKQRQRERLADIVSFARVNSPYYRELYQGLPERVTDPTLLPVTDKKKLMARFDDWSTDSQVTLEKVRPFIENPDLFGKQFLGKYLVITTSGTTGTHGLFLVDRHSLSVIGPLFLSMLSDWLTPREVRRFIRSGGRIGLVLASGTPTATGVSITHFASRLGKSLRALSVRAPLPELVAGLNEFQPAFVISYGTVMKLLASEQEAGCLQIKPVMALVTAEGLALDEYDHIAEVFNTKLGNLYASSECPFISYCCEQKWLHVNADWVVLEPVDADYQPTPPGEQSHTVLISNLANRVQPFLRYDLGDSILQRPGPCLCGNPLPAIRVQGRAADMLTLPADNGEQVAVPPLLFGTSLYQIPGIEQFQAVQTTPTNLRVRLKIADGADADHVWQAVLTELTHLLTKHKLGHITVERAEEPPEQSPGGKYREVIPLSRSTHEKEGVAL